MRFPSARRPAAAPASAAAPALGDRTPPVRVGVAAAAAPRHIGADPRRTAVRPEIQALRAVAVALVVLYHLFGDVVPGGFVGVDVFFAISGFLITSLLLREIDRTARLGLARFWARRARRLLPAALLVILACCAGTLLFVPVVHWEQFFAELRASTGYVQNWQLASSAVDYFAPHGPSPVQHFWSLSAEEQFYVAWPLLLIAALFVARGRRHRTQLRVIAGVLVTATVASLVYALVATHHDPTTAYFSTPARAWEFGAGGLLALAGASASDGGERRRALLSWLGLTAVVVAALAFTQTTPFPGTAALLPIAGALAVMRAGMPETRWAPSRVLRARPIQFLGDISYSVYLWHWPLLVFAPYVLGHDASTGVKFAILALTIAAAWLTKRFVEDPVRDARGLRERGARWSLAPALAATALVIGVTIGGTASVQARIHHDEQTTRDIVDSHPRCFGAASRDAAQPCTNPDLRGVIAPTPIEAPKLDNAPCRIIERSSRIRVCAFGAAAGAASQTIAILGDSHAIHWRPPLDTVADERGWRGLSLTRTSCPFTAAVAVIPEPDRSFCEQWNREVQTWFRQHPEVRTVFVSNHAGAAVVRHGKSAFAAQRDGYLSALRGLPATVQHVVVLRDTPRMRGNTLACVEQAVATDAARRCAVPRSVALQPDAVAAAAQQLGAPRYAVVDLTSALCDRAQCYPVVGGALAFKDEDHMTAIFAGTLAPQLGRALGRLAL